MSRVIDWTTKLTKLTNWLTDWLTEWLTTGTKCILDGRQLPATATPTAATATATKATATAAITHFPEWSECASNEPRGGDFTPKNPPLSVGRQVGVGITFNHRRLESTRLQSVPSLRHRPMMFYYSRLISTDIEYAAGDNRWQLPLKAAIRSGEGRAGGAGRAISSFLINNC